jgi:hypothetical protein
MTAIRIVLGPGNHPRSYRVQMDIADELTHIDITLAQDRSVAPLENVTYGPVLAVIILTVSGEQTMHDPAYCCRFALDKQVDMVRHQAKRI